MMSLACRLDGYRYIGDRRNESLMNQNGRILFAKSPLRMSD
ncbi:hypothetical protein [[Phormidium] sp. ETS-05]|nr:hypothetical protein [[Phormidium] sp. ETS-05]